MRRRHGLAGKRGRVTGGSEAPILDALLAIGVQRVTFKNEDIAIIGDQARLRLNGDRPSFGPVSSQKGNWSSLPPVFSR